MSTVGAMLSQQLSDAYTPNLTVLTYIVSIILVKIIQNSLRIYEDTQSI